MAKVKLSKKARELEEDLRQEEVEEQSSLEAFASKNKKILMGVGIAVVVGILAFVAFNVWNKSKNDEANELMFQAVKYFEADSLDLALNGDATGNPGLLDIENDYSTTDAANLAGYYIGIIYLKKGEIQNGIDYLEGVSLPSGSMLTVSANVALGYAYEDLGDPGRAASYFEKAANAVEANEHTTPTVLMNAGRNYEAAGENSEALRVYQRIKTDFPLSTEGRQIDKYIGRVSG